MSEQRNEQTTEEAQPIPRVERSCAGLRAMLFDELDRLNCGGSDAKSANAKARTASVIIQTVKAEIELQKYLSSLPGTKLKGAQMPVALSDFVRTANEPPPATVQ